MLKILVLSVIIASGLLVGAQGAQAASCSESYYRSVLSILDKLDVAMRKCGKAQKKRNASIDQICSACKPSVLLLSQLDRKVSSRKSCFADKKSKRFVAALANLRSEVRFMRRGCGY